MTTSHDDYLSAGQVRARFGGRSHMWLVRRLADDADFPRPLYIAKRRYWRRDALEAWERKVAARVDRPSRQRRHIPVETAGQ